MNGDPLRVLLVEDDVDHAEVIRRTLLRQEPPFALTTVDSGPACLEALRRGSYSIVLLDYSLPGMSGLEVLERIRGQGVTVPVVIVTGQGDERVAVRAMRSGGTDYVVKTSGYVTALPTLLYKVLQQHELALENARLFRETKQALSDLRAAQEHLVRVETLRALGELVGGLAHHMNNLLAVVAGRVESLLAKPESEALRHPLETIGRAAKEGADVVRRVQEFSRMKQLHERQAVDLNDLAREAVAMTRVRWRDAAQVRGISVEMACELGAVPTVSGQPSSLKEVLVNLILNAIDALPAGGRISIRTWVEDTWVMLSVADDGVGMSPETLGRAQEPFFTTKGLRSTGLGLSMSYSICQRHGGHLGIESTEGRGTTVTVRLPASPSASLSTPPAPPTSESQVPLTILVVDDEEDVLDMLVDLVRMQGHTVTQASGPREALARLEREGAPDVVLTDLGMPEMTGWDLAAAVKRRWPEVTIGLITGWGQESPALPEHRAAVDFVLAKPVSVEDLEQSFLRTRGLAQLRRARPCVGRTP